MHDDLLLRWASLVHQPTLWSHLAHRRELCEQCMAGVSHDWATVEGSGGDDATQEVMGNADGSPLSDRECPWEDGSLFSSAVVPAAW